MIENPTHPILYAEIKSVQGSPGAWQSMRFDLYVRTATGTQVLVGVAPSNDGPEDYDVIAPRPGTPVGVSYRGNSARFIIPFHPVTTECTDP